MDSTSNQQSVPSSNEIENKHNNSVRDTARLLRRTACTCSTCHAPAYPIEQKGNEFRCVRCHKQFCNHSYNLGCRQGSDGVVSLRKDPTQILNMAYYDDAIRLIKIQHKRDKYSFCKQRKHVDRIRTRF